MDQTAIVRLRILGPSSWARHPSEASSAVPGEQRGSCSPVEQSSDEALMAMLRDGEQDAIACLFRRHARVIHGVGKRVLRDAAEAEDLVQEVFLYVFRKRDLYDSSSESSEVFFVSVWVR
jgi:hypothetical protein